MFSNVHIPGQPNYHKRSSTSQIEKVSGREENLLRILRQAPAEKSHVHEESLIELCFKYHFAQKILLIKHFIYNIAWH